MAIKRIIIGDTIKVTWINSGASPSAISVSLYDGSETLVSSSSMVDSGNGHYYYNLTVPDSPGYYVAETLATIDGYPYKRRLKFQTVTEQVD